MLPPVIKRAGRGPDDRSRERGVTMALVALAIFSIIAMAGLTIDVGTLYEASAEAQRAADAAALAAARTISSSGITGDPNNSTLSWTPVCGGTSSLATLTAQAVAEQNTVGGATLTTSQINVYYSAGSASSSGTNTDCTSLAGTSFGVNPVVTVKVTQPNLATYFSRIWGVTSNRVSATASAEVFNPSGSDAYASEVVPVQPRCVKPWIVPNYDPGSSNGCLSSGNPNACKPFVSTSDGTIQDPGMLANAGGKQVIGERFWLMPDCGPAGSSCTLTNAQPQPNVSIAGHTPNVQYVPGQASFASVAVPSDGTTACGAVASATGSNLNYSEAIAGCDQSTQYQCGKTGMNYVDTSANPANGDTTNGVQCLIHATAAATGQGQDWLTPFLTNPNAIPNYPFQIQAGANNPLLKGTVKQGDFITSSASIVSVPIYDVSTGVTFSPGTTAVTIVGFLQVFIYAVDAAGDLYVAVMNVSGCGNAAPNTNYLTGTSPVPVRLITPP